MARDNQLQRLLTSYKAGTRRSAFYSDRAFTWRKTIFQSILLKNSSCWEESVGFRLWTASCWPKLHTFRISNCVSLWQLCKVDFYLHLLSTNLYCPCQKKNLNRLRRLWGRVINDQKKKKEKQKPWKSRFLLVRLLIFLKKDICAIGL